MSGPRTGSANREAFVYPDRSHPHGARYIQNAVSRAQSLVSIVREEDARSVAAVLDGLSYEQTAAVVVVLAAMVPDDVPVSDLTAWVHEQRPGLASVS